MLERQVGEVIINRIIESERPDFDAAGFFPTITPEQWAPYRQRLAGWAMDPGVNGLVFPMQSFLLRTRHHTIVVDTCVGDHKERARPNWNMTSSGEYLKRFAETGVRPEQAAPRGDAALMGIECCGHALVQWIHRGQLHAADHRQGQQRRTPCAGADADQPG